MRSQTKQFASWVNIALALLIVFVLWELTREAFQPPKGLMPSTGAIVGRLAELATTSGYWRDLMATCFRAIVGFAIGASGGILIGMAIGFIGSRARSLILTIDFFRSIPISTLYPIFIILFSVGDLSKIMMVAYATFFIVALNAAYGVNRSNPVRSDVARLLGASTLYIMLSIKGREAVKQVSLALQTTLSLSLIVAILLEMFMGSREGLGQRVMESYSIYDGTTMNAYILTAGIVGLAANLIYVALYDHSFRWKDYL
jgi:NitT/TauT family transport system permease protein